MEGARAWKFTSLTTLDLSQNKIGAEGAIALSQGNLSGLTNLYLDRNMI